MEMLVGSPSTQNDDARLDLLLHASYVSGFSLDLLELLSRGMDENSVRIFSGNVLNLPRNIKSSDTSYFSRILKAPLSDSR